MPTLTRRSALVIAGSTVVLPLMRGLGRSAAAAEGETESYGLAVFDDLALPADFKALAYVNPQAPKGGSIVIEPTTVGNNQNFTTFDTLNVYILKGSGAAGVGAIFDTLMSGTLDEPDALYGLVARSVRWSADRLTYRFKLRPEARFHDGSKLTAADVAFSLDILRTQGHPNIVTSLRDLDKAEAEADDIVAVTLKPGHSRQLPLIVAGQPIFSKAFYTAHTFDETTLTPPLGSGGYRIGAFDQGRFIEFNRVPDYWAKDLPINVGQGNFDVIRYEYYRERQVGFEAFKSGAITFHEDATSINWAKGYDFPAVTEGRVKRDTVPDEAPRGAQGWWLNSRRPQFADPRIREALGLAFDFEWTNRNIMFGLYQRTWSYFQNSPMAATGLPGPDELKLLEPFRGKVADTVFGEAVMPPVSDGSGQDRALLSRAFKLFQEAGCKRDGNVLKLPNGQPFRVEFLDFQGSLERHTSPYIKNLRLLGIDASFRIVDAAQYQSRVNTFDYDVVTLRYGASFTPGEDLRVIYGSQAAHTPGSLNLTGVADPVLDALIAKALVAGSRPELNAICKCIDRILRAGYYGVLMWNNPDHWLAFWDQFSWPSRRPKFDPGVLSTWWYDKDKAAKTKVGG